MKIAKIILKEIVEWLEFIVCYFPGRCGFSLRKFWYRRRINGKKVNAIGVGCKFTNPKNITLGNLVSFGDNCRLYAEHGTIYCGDNTTFNNNVQLNVSKGGVVLIGSDCLLGPGVTIFSSNHNYSDVRIPIRRQGHTVSNVQVGNDCWIGANTTILAGAIIGDGSIIGAGSVVIGDLPAFTVAAGVPAVVVKNREKIDAKS